jgi:hypothetical protein
MADTSRFIPWIGVTAAGFGLGQIYTLSSDRRRTLQVRQGIGLTGAFFILRGINVYGDPFRWATQKSSASNTVKRGVDSRTFGAWRIDQSQFVERTESIRLWLAIMTTPNAVTSQFGK